MSFYRGEIPNYLPEEVALKRKGHDTQWLATLPLRLPVSFPLFHMITEISFVFLDSKCISLLEHVVLFVLLDDILIIL